MISPLDVVAARRRVAPYLPPSPLRQSFWLSDRLHAQVHLKLDCVQLTNSFKIRGAFNAALRLRETAPQAPRLVTASAGNHGRALALVCERLHLDLTVFTPRTAPETKRAAIRQHGAALRSDFADYDAAESAGREFAARAGAVFISPYNHADVIAGAGTLALEILDRLPSFDVLIVPLGGGGLASGLGTVIEAIAPNVRMVGVETANSTPFAASMAAGQIVHIDARPSLADGLTGNLEPGAITFDIVRRTVDHLVSVDEDDIASALVELASEEHLITEGAGAVATAAALTRNVINPGETAVILLTGANVDAARMVTLLATRRSGTQ